MARKKVTDQDRHEAVRRLLVGLAAGQDTFELSAAAADLHPKNNTFPGELYLQVAAEVLTETVAAGSGPIEYEGLRADIPRRDRVPGQGQPQDPVRRAVQRRHGWRAGARSTLPPAPAPVVSGARYRVVNVNSAKALENPGSSRRAGTQLTQRTSGTSTNQRWTFTANGDDTYSIRNVASGLCADVSGSSQSAGAVIQWTCTGSANQRWRVAPAASGGYTLVPAHSGRCLDVSGSSRLNGAPVIQWSCTGNANQRWTFTRVS